LSAWQYAVPKDVHYVVHQKDSELSILDLNGYRLHEGDVEEIHSADHESVFFAAEGSLQVDIDEESYSLWTYDTAYAPVGTTARVRVLSQACPAAMPMAKTTTVKEPFVVHFSEALAEPRRKESHGSLSPARNVLQYFGLDEEMLRIFAGATTSRDGSRSAWPPHKDETTIEGLYFYFDMHSEGYQNGRAYAARNDAVLTVPAACHPMVASPGNRARYLYVMGSEDEGKYKPSGYWVAAHVHPASETQTFQL
jgi:5-deoxy-D-glucuronate isomerase